MRDNAVAEICEEFERLRGIQTQVAALSDERDALNDELEALRQGIQKAQHGEDERSELANENERLHGQLAALTSSTTQREVLPTHSS
jgi:uncharacterized coiled-coil DUF342 family protein